MARYVRRPGRWDDDCRPARPRRFVDGDRVIGGVSGDAHERALDCSEQIEGGGRIITRLLGQRVDTDHAGLIDAKVEFPPATPAAATVFRGSPLTGPDDGQTCAVKHEMDALVGRDRSQTARQMLTAPGERRIVGGGEVEAHHPEQGVQEPFGLAQREMVEESQGQGGLDGEIRVAPLPTPPAAPAGRPGSDRLRGQPHRHIAASNEGLVIGRPLHNAVLRLVRGMDLRLHPCSVAPAEGHEKCGPNFPHPHRVFMQQRHHTALRPLDGQRRTRSDHRLPGGALPEAPPGLGPLKAHSSLIVNRQAEDGGAVDAPGHLARVDGGAPGGNHPGTPRRGAFRVIDNRTSELTSWDTDLLPDALAGLNDLDIFSFDDVLPLAATAGKTDPDDIPETPKNPVSHRGHLDTREAPPDVRGRHEARACRAPPGRRQASPDGDGPALRCELTTPPGVTRPVSAAKASRLGNLRNTTSPTGRPRTRSSLEGSLTPG